MGEARLRELQFSIGFIIILDNYEPYEFSEAANARSFLHLLRHGAAHVE
jgi:hypothetical protein